MTAFPSAVEEVCFHGPAGEFVLRTEPHSEAHPMALLVQFLVAFGCACGRGAHYQVEADRHYPAEFCVLVGPTARGRKGSAWGHVRRLLEDADPALGRCLVGGLSSGEGLIAQVRDPVDEHDAQASADKRRLVAELRDTVRLTVRFAQEHRRITFDDAARERWIEIYEQLSCVRPGLAGAATARAEAHTVRLALIYRCLTSPSGSASSTSRPPWRCGATAPPPPRGSSATRSAIRPPMTSGVRQGPP